MSIGQLLKAAMNRRGLTQDDVAERAKMGTGALSKILNGKRQPTFPIIERIADAIGVGWGELFEVPHTLLSAEDAAILRGSIPALRHSLPVLVRILENDATQREIAEKTVQPPPPRDSRRKPARQGLPPGSEVRDSSPIHQEVQPTSGKVPEWAVRLGATRPYTVHTDSMIGAGILQGAKIYVRTSVDTAAADDSIIVCTLNKSTYLKRLDLRGGRTVLESANPRYAQLTVTDDDDFAMIGVVVGV